MLSYDISQSPPSTVIVEVGTALEDTVEFGNLKLHIDPHFNPTNKVRIYGTVIALPAGVPKNEYGEEIEPELKVGDKVYFHYLSINDETNNIYGNYYKVPYYWIFCAVRNNDILPIGSWTFCSTIIEETYNGIEVNGKKVDAELSSSGLVVGLKKKPSVKTARLEHIGSPFRGKERLPVSKGDLVVLNKNSNFVNKIEGKEYYTLKQEDILGKKCV